MISNMNVVSGKFYYGLGVSDKVRNFSYHRFNHSGGRVFFIDHKSKDYYICSKGAIINDSGTFLDLDELGYDEETKMF